MRLILIPTANRPECIVALDVAFTLAERLGADVAGYYLSRKRVGAPAAVRPLTVDDAYFSSARTGGRLVVERAAAREVFSQEAKRHDFRIAKRPRRGGGALALWHEMFGAPARVFGIIGAVADLSVVSRPTRGGVGPGRAFLLAALMHTARPVLVVPHRRLRSIGTRIVVAWNQSPDAALAVTAAIPLMQRAERVVIVTCGPEDRAGPKAAHLGHYLRHWDVDVEYVSTRGRHVEKEIEQTYRKIAGDLLVMGAYSRSRFRELVFGGVTEHMLFATECPVLMLHR